MDWLLGSVVLIAACAVIARAILTPRTVVKRSRAVNLPPLAESANAAQLPYSKQRYFFSKAEQSFYEILCRLASDYTVFAKVRLADVVHVSKGTGAWQSHFNRISAKHLDFVLCDRNLAPVIAIELDDASHDTEAGQSRDDFVDQVLASAALPIVHVRAKRGYALDEVRELLRPYGPALSPEEVLNGDARYMSLTGWRPAV